MHLGQSICIMHHHSLELQIVHGELAKGGIWTCLYSSRDHGLSMNRFQHHCFDYKQPSVMIVDCLNKETDEMYSFALAMDSEWR